MDANVLALGGSGAALVVAGVVGRNSTEQTWSQAFKRSAPAFSLLFLVGCALLAVAVARNRVAPAQWAAWVAAAAVVGSTAAMKSQMRRREPICHLLPVVFGVAWLLLGWVATSQLEGCSKAWGPIGGALVVAGLLWLLPYQRKQCIVDGPGMAAFALGCGVLAVGNAVRGTLPH
jgi:hypothetical protein